jgi:hypothetical protein
MRGASTIAADLSLRERVLLFCVARRAHECARAGVAGATATAMVVRGLTLLAAAVEVIQ